MPLRKKVFAKPFLWPRELKARAFTRQYLKCLWRTSRGTKILAIKLKKWKLEEVLEKVWRRHLK